MFLGTFLTLADIAWGNVSQPGLILQVIIILSAEVAIAHSAPPPSSIRTSMEVCPLQICLSLERLFASQEVLAWVTNV